METGRRAAFKEVPCRHRYPLSLVSFPHRHPFLYYQGAPEQPGLSRHINRLRWRQGIHFYLGYVMRVGSLSARSSGLDRCGGARNETAVPHRSSPAAPRTVREPNDETALSDALRV